MWNFKRQIKDNIEDGGEVIVDGNDLEQIGIDILTLDTEIESMHTNFSISVYKECDGSFDVKIIDVCGNTALDTNIEKSTEKFQKLYTFLAE